MGDVNIPCTSYMIHCYAAEISGIVYYVKCCYAADGVGWGVGDRCVQKEISGIVVFKNFKSKDFLLYVKCWQWRYVNGHSRLQQKTISTLKCLV